MICNAGYNLVPSYELTNGNLKIESYVLANRSSFLVLYGYMQLCGDGSQCHQSKVQTHLCSSSVIQVSTSIKTYLVRCLHSGLATSIRAGECGDRKRIFPNGIQTRDLQIRNTVLLLLTMALPLKRGKLLERATRINI